MKNWTEDIKAGDLPGLLKPIADVIGIDATLKLAEGFGGGEIYLSKAEGVILDAKRKFILDNPKMTVQELRILTKYSDRQIIRIRNNGSVEKAASLQESFL